MKHLPLGLFIGHLLFISAKSVYTPLTIEESVISVLLLILVIGQKLYLLTNKKLYRSYLIEKAKIELEKPKPLDPEIAALQKENDVTALRLRKFMAEQEFNKREAARIVESKVQDGGLRF